MDDGWSLQAIIEKLSAVDAMKVFIFPQFEFKLLISNFLLGKIFIERSFLNFPITTPIGKFGPVQKVPVSLCCQSLWEEESVKSFILLAQFNMCV